MPDKNRAIFEKADFLLNHFPALMILGVRQVGKTTLAKQLRPNWYYLDLEKPHDFQLISSDPEFFLSRHPDQLILDEAQEYSTLFKILRGVIDQNRAQKGRFIITGSSSPDLLKQASESLAGRIAIIELSTFKISEYYDYPLSDFYKIFETTSLNKEALPEGNPPLTREQIHKIWLLGGYPEAITAKSSIIYSLWMENYQTTYLYRDIARLFPRLNKVAFQRFLTMLGGLSGTILNRAELARILEISEPTVKEYLAIAEGTFLWRQLPSYEKNISKSIVKMSKGHLADTGLLHHILKITSLDTLYAHPVVGRSFEGFVVEEMLKGLQATLSTNWDYHYYRTRNGAEIDLILEGSFGVLPIEIKYGTQINLRQLKSLTTFVSENRLAFGLLINQGERAEWISPYIFQLPIGWL